MNASANPTASQPPAFGSLKAARKHPAPVMAARLAHDLNDALTAIAGFVETALAASRPDDPRRRYLVEIQEASQRALGLALQLSAQQVKSGQRLVRLFHRRRPHLRIVFTSGYSRGALAEAGLDAASARFLARPFTADAVIASLDSLLQKKTTPVGHSEMRSPPSRGHGWPAA